MCNPRNSHKRPLGLVQPAQLAQSGLSGRSLRRTLRVQVVAGDARASSPRAPCRLARVSMKPRCRLHEPIRFINCSTSSFYSTIFIQNPGHLCPVRERKCLARERGQVPHKAKANPKDTKLIASSLSIECFGKKYSPQLHWRLQTARRGKNFYRAWSAREAAAPEGRVRDSQPRSRVQKRSRSPTHTPRGSRLFAGRGEGQTHTATSRQDLG